MVLVITIINKKGRGKTINIGKSQMHRLAAEIGAAASTIKSVSKKTGLSVRAIKSGFLLEMDNMLQENQEVDHE